MWHLQQAGASEQAGKGRIHTVLTGTTPMAITVGPPRVQARQMEPPAGAIPMIDAPIKMKACRRNRRIEVLSAAIPTGVAILAAA